MKESLAPIVSKTSKLLILGSLPGEMSLQKQEYYAHPQNSFWRLMSQLFGENPPLDYDGKIGLLLRHDIALWDVVGQAEREGSLDSNIKHPVPNEIGVLVQNYPSIKKIILNGQKAALLYKKFFGDLGIKSIQVPSTSPARANLTFEQKLAEWQEAFRD